MSQFTKKAIIASFLRLLEDRPLDKITVKDIIEDCDVSRGTFYYYFPDIYALVETVFEEECARLLKENPIGDSFWQEGFLKATELAKASKRRLYHAYNAINHEKMEEYLYQVVYHLLFTYVDQQAQGLSAAKRDQELVCMFYTNALVSLISRWINHGMKEDAAEYIREMGRLFSGNIRTVLERCSQPSAEGKN